MQHLSFVCGPQRYREMLARLKANGVAIEAGPLLTIPPAIVCHERTEGGAMLCKR